METCKILRGFFMVQFGAEAEDVVRGGKVCP